MEERVREGAGKALFDAYIHVGLAYNHANNALHDG